MDKFYKISEKDLKYLIECRAKLEALEAGGVDNWSWYDESQDDYLEDYFSDYEPEWFEEDDNVLTFEMVADKEIQNYQEI